MGLVLSEKLANLHELKSIYDTEDLWDLWEVAAISNYNRA